MAEGEEGEEKGKVTMGRKRRKMMKRMVVGRGKGRARRLVGIRVRVV